MSSYINFYLRCNDHFVPLVNYSRSHCMYRAYDDAGVAPYGKLHALTPNDINTITENLHEQVDSLNEHLNSYAQQRVDISSFNNSVEDKMSALRDIYNNEEECRQSINVINAALLICAFLLDIMENAQYADDDMTKSVDFNIYNYKPNSIIYCGIETYLPTVNDIIS